MKTTRIVGVAVLVAGSGLAPHVEPAQLAGTRRTDLQRHDLSTNGAELATYVVEERSR